MASKSVKPLIFVVEDDQFLVKAYEAKLTRVSFRVAVARDGEEAILFLKKQIPDLILLDLVIPKRDGFEVLHELRTSPEWSKIPVIILTNLGQESDQKRGMELGAVDYLVKTDYTLEQIVEVINKFLRRRS